MNVPIITVESELCHIRLRQALDAWRVADRAWQQAREDWVTKVLNLAIELNGAREECGCDDRAFGKWLIENSCDDLQPKDRNALIRMGEHVNLARKVLEETGRRSLRHIFEQELKPLILAQVGQDHLERRPSVDHRARINIPEGQTITGIVHKVGELVACGMPVATAIRQTSGLSNQTFQMARDIVLLAGRNDLSPEDAALAKRVLEEAERTRRVKRLWAQIRPIIERLWGKKGNRYKADKHRSQKFDHAISFVLNACETASEIDIPYVTEVSAVEKIERLEEAVSSLRKFMERIRESAQHG